MKIRSLLAALAATAALLSLSACGDDGTGAKIAAGGHTMNETAFLMATHQHPEYWRENSSDGQLLAIGHGACTSLQSGYSGYTTAMAISQKFGWSLTAAAYLTGAAIPTLCVDQKEV